MTTMRLEDWPIWINGGYGERWCECHLPIEGEDGPNCYGILGVEKETTPGKLIGSIVEHAKSAHGIEIKPSGYWYRSFTPDGELWSESSSVDDYGPVDLDGMEGEELEHFAKRNEVEKTLTYQRIAVYTLSVAAEWKPDGDASTA